MKRTFWLRYEGKYWFLSMEDGRQMHLCVSCRPSTCGFLSVITGLLQHGNRGFINKKAQYSLYLDNIHTNEYIWVDTLNLKIQSFVQSYHYCKPHVVLVTCFYPHPDFLSLLSCSSGPAGRPSPWSRTLLLSLFQFQAQPRYPGFLGIDVTIKNMTLYYPTHPSYQPGLSCQASSLPDNEGLWR